MKSSIKIDFYDNGKGLDPVIKVLLICTDDPRDKLLAAFFQKLGGDSNWLRVSFDGHEGVMPQENYITIYPVGKDELKDQSKDMADRVAVGRGGCGDPPNNNPCFVPLANNDIRSQG